MQIDILGPLRITHENLDITPTAPKLRQVFALLSTCANIVVSHERFIEELWESGPPTSVTTTLQTYIYQLRKMINSCAGATGGADGGFVLRTSRRGYMLNLGNVDEIDVARFEEAVRMGTQELEAAQAENAADTLRRALQLWRGPALADVESGPILSAERLRLEELRKTALERRIEADFQLGRHARLVGELTGLLAQSPTNEHMASQLMLALHRSNRRVEALGIYEKVRGTLIKQLGLDPSPELRRLHTAILNSDQALALPAPPVAVPAPRRSAPCHLPQRGGRPDLYQKELAAALAELGSTGRSGPASMIITGPPGAGKGSLATEIAYEARQWYPDGQLYARLTDQRGQAADSFDVLGSFLRALDGPVANLPSTTQERAYAFRAATADRRVLVLLDDVVSTGQLADLLPAGDGCAAVVGTRFQLCCRAIETVFELSPLDTEGAMGYLRDAAGRDRMDQDPAAALELVELCGGVPVALESCADKLRARPGWTLARMIAWIGRARAADATRDPLNLRPGIEHTYWCLPQDAREVFSLFVSSPRPFWTPESVAETLGLPELEAETLLESLVDAQLIGTCDATRPSYRCSFAITAACRGLPIKTPGVPPVSPRRELVQGGRRA
ncbi:AfsR/SARP family transcriptional regulator [Amycolatopsis ultiminotia]|uniref:AfsR/SARP family transcriptional regulator n=1 Tax=Amycolatopsis ultiminotia TaxID=543629 RepID=A0ABP6YNH2_9PSEU